MWHPKGWQGDCISTTPSVNRLSIPRTLQSPGLSRKLHTHSRQGAKHRRALRLGVVLSNVVVLLVIAGVILQNHSPGAMTKAPAFASSADTAGPVNPLDQLSSADIALTVARVSSLPESTAINNQAQSEAADLAMASTNDNVIAKPQVVTTALKSRADIQTYIARAGDTVASVAAKFGVTSDSIRWSNNLSSIDIAAGSRLFIPPVNGIVYTVKPGDTPDSVANHFRTNKDKLIAYNDAEIGGFTAGEQILIPDGTLVSTNITAQDISGGGFPWGTGPVYGYNGYDYGFCTWYVATQVPVPANWGNASTWSYYASLSGWNVSSHPTVGSIAQTPYAAGGEGHVAIVDAVSPDGSQIQIRDMNGVAGWGRVGYSGWIPTSTFVHYITQ